MCFGDGGVRFVRDSIPIATWRALATRAGDRVDLIAWDRRIRGRVTGATGGELLNRMVDTMATVDPVPWTELFTDSEAYERKTNPETNEPISQTVDPVAT